jgi:hypothetical protein
VEQFTFTVRIVSGVLDQFAPLYLYLSRAMCSAPQDGYNIQNFVQGKVRVPEDGVNDDVSVQYLGPVTIQLFSWINRVFVFQNRIAMESSLRFQQQEDT